jgi:hypothetical protein
MISPQSPQPAGDPSPLRYAGALLACTCMPAVLMAAAIAPQDPPRQDPPPPAANTPASGEKTAKPSPAMIRGQLRSRYYLRWTGEDVDNDLVETLSLDIGHAETDKVTGHLMGRLAYDIDGYDSTFASINDSYGGRLDGLVYDAYVDFHQLSGFSLLRLGRQSVYETPEVAYFDGVHVTSEELGKVAFQAGAYLGSSTHLYESSKAGDLTAGAYLQLKPWQDGRVRFDYMHLEDDARLGSHKSELLSAGYWQSIGKFLQLDTHYSRLENRDRDVLGRAVSRISDWGLMLQASYFSLLTTQGDLVLEADPFFNALNALHPYDQWSLLAAQEVSHSLQVQAAADLRRVRDAEDIAAYNRDYDHYYGTATLMDVGTAGLRCSGTIDFWDSDSQMVRSWGADATYQFSRSSASIGTYYSLYKFDLFTNSERDHVRTYYMKLRHKFNDSVTLEGDYELEDNDYDQYQRLRLGVTWNF